MPTNANSLTEAPVLIDSEINILRGFHGLYGGGLASRLRQSGNPSAMPPWAETYWLGRQVVKSPMDLWVYQEIIVETRPDLIIETGTSGSGSAFFFAHILDWLGHGKIITVDTVTYPELCTPHPRIEYLVGDSTSQLISDNIRSKSVGQRVMLSLDALHTYEHVHTELELYGELTGLGCYIVVEDTGWGDVDDYQHGNWSCRAAAEFTHTHPNFTADRSRERHLFTSNRGGWIRRNS